ncbi:Nn.00g108910.m01.CDS01 [Neocucurbitaria sp. VM-36]
MTSATQLNFVTVDVFTSQPYEGNPLAVVRIPHGSSVSQEQKQTIAREFNLSETTFLHEKGGTRKKMLGTACYILGRVAQERGIRDGVIEASFNLKAGPVGLQYDVARGTTKADIPHNVHIHEKRWTRDELFALQPQLAGAFQQGRIQAKQDYAIVSIVKGMTFVLIELESLEALSLVSLASRALKLDGLDEGWSDTFIGTYFFVRTGEGKGGSTALRTRMIEGPLEDPATGSAASDLAAYLSITEGTTSETSKYEIVQGVEMGRRSEILIEIDMAEDKSVSKLYLHGGAVQVMEGQLRI